ncbi:unnamed protein product [Arabidopsis halleri]
MIFFRYIVSSFVFIVGLNSFPVLLGLCFPLLGLVSGDISLVRRRLYFNWYSTLGS